MTSKDLHNKALDEVWGAMPSLQGTSLPKTSPFLRILTEWFEVRDLEKYLHWI